MNLKMLIKQLENELTDRRKWLLDSKDSLKKAKRRVSESEEEITGYEKLLKILKRKEE